MTDQIDFEGLARGAFACPHWRWLPGMLDTYDRRVMAVQPDQDWILWSDGEETTGHTGALPDLSDAATRGCLLELVRAAWGKHRDFRLGTGRRLITKSGYASLEVWESGSRLHEFYGGSEAEALVAALEAAPR